ncbi:hypothetical protein, partial [Desulfovibrio sp.]
KDLRWTEIRISKFLPVRYSLVNEPHRFTRREAVVYATSFSLSTSFFFISRFFFAAPPGQLVGARETYVSFSNPRQGLFAIRENPFSRRPFGHGQLIGANGFMRLFNPTVKHLSAKKFCGFAPCRLFIQPTYWKDTENVGDFPNSTCPPKDSCRQRQNGAPTMPPAPRISK